MRVYNFFHASNEYKIWFGFRNYVNNALMMMILGKSVLKCMLDIYSSVKSACHLLCQM